MRVLKGQSFTAIYCCGSPLKGPLEVVIVSKQKDKRGVTVFSFFGRIHLGHLSVYKRTKAMGGEARDLGVGGRKQEAGNAGAEQQKRCDSHRYFLL